MEGCHFINMGPVIRISSVTQSTCIVFITFWLWSMSFYFLAFIAHLFLWSVKSRCRYCFYEFAFRRYRDLIQSHTIPVTFLIGLHGFLIVLQNKANCGILCLSLNLDGLWNAQELDHIYAPFTPRPTTRWKLRAHWTRLSSLSPCDHAPAPTHAQDQVL